MKGSKLSATAAALMLAFASTVPGAAQSGSQEANTQTYYATQVTQGPCVTPGTEFFGPILSALLGSLVTTGVNKIGAALRTAGNARTWRVTASRNLDLTAAEFDAQPCVQIVRGRFFTNAPPANRRPADLSDPRVINAWPTLVRNGLYLAGQPDFFFEGRLSRSSGGQALTLVPLYARLDSPIGRRFLRSGRSRHVAVFLTYFAPGQAQLVSESNASASVVLGELRPGVARDFTEGVRPASSPVTDELGTSLTEAIRRCPPRPAADAPACSEPIPASASSWFNLALVEGKQPLTLGILVTETQGADAFLSFIGGVLGSEEVTAAVSTALVSQIDPAEREEARTQAQSAAATLRGEYESALAEAIEKTNACTTGAPSFSAITEARAAIRELIEKASARGFASSLDETDVLAIRYTDDASGVRAACSAAEAQVRSLAVAHP